MGEKRGPPRRSVNVSVSRVVPIAPRVRAEQLFAAVRPQQTILPGAGALFIPLCAADQIVSRRPRPLRGLFRANPPFLPRRAAAAAPLLPATPPRCAVFCVVLCCGRAGRIFGGGPRTTTWEEEREEGDTDQALLCALPLPLRPPLEEVE